MSVGIKLSQINDFFEQASAQSSSFPREMALSHNILLAALAVGFAVFIVIAFFRRSVVAVTAASVVFMTGLLQAYSFGLLEFFPSQSLIVFQGLFIASVLLFLTASVNAAKENPVLGALLLIAMVGALVMVALGIAQVYPDAARVLRLSLAGVAFFATILTLHQGFGSDRRAMLIAPGTVLASSSLLAILIGGNLGVNNWIGAIIPHVMLTGGVLMAGVMALLAGNNVVGATAGKGKSVSPRAEPAMAFAGEDEEVSRLRAERPAEEVSPSKQKEPARVEPQIAPEPLPVSKAEPNPKVDTPPIVKEESKRQIEPESPISALWGKSAEPSVRSGGGLAAKAAPTKAVVALSSTVPMWLWAGDHKIEVNDAALALFRASDKAAFTPENLRNLIAHEDLETFDEAILGGGDPKSGKFDVVCKMAAGGALKLAGERRVDAEGFVESISSSFEHVREDQPTIAAAVPDESYDIRQAELLRQAIAAGEIKPFFQPIVRIRDGEIIGFEALARWVKPGATEPVPADEFIPLAISAGMETDLIRVIISGAAEELARWLVAQPGQGQFVSFNVSAKSLISDALVGIVRDEIKQHNLPKGALVVELTESHVTEDQSKALNVIKGLNQAGARLALDDLGAGHSSLSRLSKFNFDIVKTDKSLLAPAMSDPTAMMRLQDMIAAAKKMGTQIVVEGVETADAAVMLGELQADLAQGFHFGGPEPADQPASDAESRVSADLR